MQRWLDITHFLAQHDVQASVVTIDEQVATFPSIDVSLKDRIHPSVKIFTTQTGELFSVYKKYIGKGKVPSTGLADEPDPNFLQKVARFVRGNFFLPDPRIGWNKYALEMATRVIEEERIGLFFTAGPPHSTHLVGLQLKKRFPQLKWIADIHDYWTDVSYLKLFYRTAIATFFDRKLERKVLNGADAVMTHCNASRELLGSRITRGRRDKVFVHTMGFNEALFPIKPPKEQAAFVLSYVGMITSAYKPAPFFKALANAIALQPDIPFRLQFVGSFDPALNKVLEETGLTAYVTVTGYVPHGEAIASLYKSSALLIINPEFDKERMHVPGKLYEYLATFKPVISISASGSETGQILEACNAGRHFERDDTDGMTAYIVELMAQWKEQRNIDLPYNPTVYTKYGRRSEVASLAERIRTLLQ